MRDHRSWSLSLSHWGQVDVRLHAFFFLFSAFILYEGWLIEKFVAQGDMIWVAVSGIMVLFVSVLLHEIFRCRVAVVMGGACDRLILTPWGGLSTFHQVHDPKAEFWVAAAGPFCHLSLCVLALAVLLATGKYVDLLALLHPFLPSNILESTYYPLGRFNWPEIVQLTLWVNWLLFLLNLLPMFPFDGGMMLRACIRWFQPRLSRRKANAIVVVISKLTAIALVIAALLGYMLDAARVMPVWFPLLLISVLVFFGGQQEEDVPEEEMDRELFGYDFSQGYTSLERSTPRETEASSAFSRWLERRRQIRLQRQEQLERDEEERCDEILRRLHEHGRGSLSRQDEEVLQRVAQRYRNRS